MTRRWQAAVVAVVVAVATIGLPAGGHAGVRMTPVAPGTRAMWLWTQAPAGAVADWAGTHGVKEIFAYVAPAPSAAELARLRELRALTSAAGIRLVALGGEARWAYDHAAALAWLRAVDATGLFAGYHVDVEPYLLPEWTTARAATSTNYLALLDKLRRSGKLPLEADVPFWYGQAQFAVNGRNLATEILNRVTAVTVMSYRDTGTGPNSILEVSRDWLARGAAAGKRVRLGAETGALADCSYCTFAEEGATALGTELAKVDAATRQAYGYAGIAEQ
ncbi:MAG TPA: hypothetical protein VES42_05720, partial [Pilimelia sp.]|nr:hypothetical protein [Pilimelia sp.]